MDIEEYIEKIIGRPIFSHEIGFLEKEIKEKSKADFIALCEEDGGKQWQYMNI